MDGRCPAHLLLHSGVAPAYPCGALVWRVAVYCRAARVDEPFFARVSPTLFTYVFYILIQTCPPLTSTCGFFVRRINRRNVKGPSDWAAQHTPYIALWNVRNQQHYLHSACHRSQPRVEYLRWLQQQSRLFLRPAYT
jgi:hypothetical protein